jgi:hypothetical protein
MVVCAVPRRTTIMMARVQESKETKKREHDATYGKVSSNGEGDSVEQRATRRGPCEN